MALNLKGIKAATFGTPSNYVDSVKYYKQNLQEKINDTYQFQNDTFEIGEEIKNGTLEFSPLVCRVCHAINPKTGLNLGDDYKDLKFFDVFSRRYMGERFRFNDSVWITTNTNNDHYSTQSAIVRRCNNTLNYIDKNGNIIREPCIVGYSIKYANIYYNTAVEIPQGTIVVTAQSNDATQLIEINDRFIFNNQVFKIKSVRDYLRDYTDNKSSVPLIEFEMYIDAESPDDNFDIGVANMSRYESVYPSENSVLNGVVFQPKDNALYQGEKKTYTCYYYKNGEKQNNEFVFTDQKNENRSYLFNVIDGNSFSVTCLNKSPTLLVINCTSGDLKQSMSVELRGLY